MTEWWRKFKAWRRRDAIAADLREEIESHLEMRASDTGSAAAAQRRFGNPGLILEDARDAWGWPRPEAWLRDLRYGLRLMKRRPGFAVTVMAALALGIGAAVTIFSIVDTVLIRPLPYAEPDRLVAIREVRLTGDRRESGAAPGRLEDWNRRSGAFESLAGCYMDTFTETSGQEPERLAAVQVSPRFFQVLRAPAQVGRVFTAEEERPGGPAVVVISHDLWRRRYSLDPNVVGRKLIVQGQSYAILGVMPREFQFPSSTTELWTPKQASAELMQVRQARFYRFIVGRLKPGVTIGRARADLEAVQARLAGQYPRTDEGWGVRLAQLQAEQVGSLPLALWLLFGSASVLLLIACTNVACLLLSQFNARAEEVATRRALGASRAAIARQLLAEGLAYAIAGSSAGILLSFAAVSAIPNWMPELPRIREIAVDYRVLAFAAGVSIAAALLVSLAPILQTLRRNDAGVQRGRGVIGRRQLLPRALVAAQLALATLLLVGSGLFVKSLVSLQETELGFAPDRVLTFRVSASFAERPPAVVQRHRRTLEAIAAIPGVQAVGISSGLPGTVAATPTEFRIRGQENAPDAGSRYALQRGVTAGYFAALSIPITSGRACRMDSDPDRAFEALVNRAFVERFLEGREALGLTITMGPPAGGLTMPVVGVVGDAREIGYARAPEPVVYACGFTRFIPDSNFLVRTRSAPEAMAHTIREKIRSMEPDRALYGLSPLADVLDGTLADNRFRAWLITAFSVLALGLGAIGVYGVTAYMVSQRIREFGIRMALGAQPGQIWAEILGTGGRLAAVGAVAGLALALLLSRLVATLLYGVGRLDAQAYSYAAAALFTAALLACIAPGRRATSIDPARALRDQ
jgi:putative ABC transport system permease protein